MLPLLALLVFTQIAELPLPGSGFQTTATKADQTKQDITIVFASNQKNESWKDDLTKSSSVDKVKKLAEVHDCSVNIDGDLVYVIDEAAFGLKRLKTEASVFAQLAKSGIEPFMPLTDKNLPSEAFNYLVQHHVDSPGFKDIYEKGSPCLYLSPSSNVTLSSNGRSLNVMLPPSEPAEKANNLINRMPDSEAKVIRQLPKHDRALYEVGQGLTRIVVTFGGRERSIYNRTVLASRIMKTASESTKKATDQCQESATHLQNIMMKQGKDSLWSNGIPDGAKSGKYDDLSGQARSQIEANVSQNYKSY